MRAYYAHCLAIYNTPQETRDLDLLRLLGFKVINPNSPAIEDECKRMREDGLADKIMESVFKPMIHPDHMECVFFRALPDGRIPAGVAKELEWAKEAGVPVLELPSFGYDRVMSLDTTRAYLREVGQR